MIKFNFRKLFVWINQNQFPREKKHWICYKIECELIYDTVSFSEQFIKCAFLSFSAIQSLHVRKVDYVQFAYKRNKFNF